MTFPLSTWVWVVACCARPARPFRHPDNLLPYTICLCTARPLHAHVRAGTVPGHERHHREAEGGPVASRTSMGLALLIARADAAMMRLARTHPCFQHAATRHDRDTGPPIPKGRAQDLDARRAAVEPEPGEHPRPRHGAARRRRLAQPALVLAELPAHPGGRDVLRVRISRDRMVPSACAESLLLLLPVAPALACLTQLQRHLPTGLRE